MGVFGKSTLLLLMLEACYAMAWNCTFSDCVILISEDDGTTKKIDVTSYNEMLTFNDETNNRYL